MINFIKGLFTSKNKESLFIKHLLEIERAMPNNYQLGSMLREKLKNYKKGEINLETKKGNFSH